MRKRFKLVATLFGRTRFIRMFTETRNHLHPITARMWLMQKVLGFNREVPWPVHFTTVVSSPQRIKIGVDCSPGYSPGCYIQGGGNVEIGDYVRIAPNVGIISSNHSITDNSANLRETVKIGQYCWLGMGCVVLPGVELGEHTTVAAGAVVTKSFPEGYCVLGGVPAKVIKRINPEICIKRKAAIPYRGFRPVSSFAS